MKVIKSTENGGYAKGNNIGLKFLAKYNPEYALILNNDVYFTENVLIECVNTYKKLGDKVGIISPLQLKPDNSIAYVGTLRCNSFLDDILSFSITYKKFSKKLEYKSNVKGDLMKVDIIPGCFVFIKFSLFEEVDFYDEDTFLFCEERFLYKKMQIVGKANYILMDCGYIHDHSHTINSEVAYLRQKKYYNDGQIAYTHKYRSLPYLKSILLKVAYQFFSCEIKVIAFLKKIKNGLQK